MPKTPVIKECPECHNSFTEFYWTKDGRCPQCRKHKSKEQVRVSYYEASCRRCGPHEHKRMNGNYHGKEYGKCTKCGGWTLLENKSSISKLEDPDYNKEEEK